MKAYFFASLLLSAEAAFAEIDLSSFLATKTWSTYLVSLMSCQQQHPSRYTPIELLRIDLIPENEFVSQARTYAEKWNQLDGQKRDKTNGEQMLGLSCNANDTLVDLVRKIEKEQKISLRGSTVALLRAIPIEMRKGLSALDGIFMKSSEIGKKVLVDLKGRPEMSLDAILLNKDGRVIDFQGQPGAWARVNMPPQTFYELSVSDYPDGRVRVRGKFTGRPDPVGSDLLLQPADLTGTFFNSNASTPYPLGAFPAAKGIWSDETGVSHYAGDGHNHAH